MASPLEISGLQQIMVKPVAWRLIEHIDDMLTLEFTHIAPDLGDWFEVRTRRGEVKRYKSCNAAIADVKRVQKDAVIYFIGN